jgi:signal transduction histidine kinase
LQQIERDLHDGTQAQLTAIAMQIGEARETLAAGGDAAAALDLLATAHTSTRGAMADLRNIARGIRPAALDAGLTTAVPPLAARSAIPVTVETFRDVDGVDPAVRSAAYYAVAELVNNAAKHAGATQVTVTLRRAAERTLLIEVEDDGVGGARIVPAGERNQGGSQTGLAALADRVAALDGTMLINSPVGGPTNIIITMTTTLTAQVWVRRLRFWWLRIQLFCAMG